MEALVYIAHGSRNEEANKAFINFIENVISNANQPIKEYSFLENSRPTISEALVRCIEKGATDITIIPVLLLPGIHANEDIPNEILKVKINSPHIRFKYSSPLGTSIELIDLLQSRLIDQGLMNQGQGTAKIILVAHGSRHPEADPVCKKIAANLEDKVNCPVQIAYLKNAPSFNDVMSYIRDGEFNSIYVIPFFLFTGGFKQQIEDTINTLHSSSTEVILCEPLGFDDQLASILKNKYDDVIDL